MKFSAMLVFFAMGTSPSLAFQSPSSMTSNVGVHDTSLYMGPSKLINSLLIGKVVDTTAPFEQTMQPHSFAPFESGSILTSLLPDAYANLPDLARGMQVPDSADISLMVKEAASAAGTSLTDAVPNIGEVDYVRNVSPEVGKLPAFPIEKFLSSMAALGDVFASGGPYESADIVKALDLEDLGAWYLGVFVLFMLLANVGNMDKDVAFEMAGGTVSKPKERRLRKSASMILVEQKLAELTETTSVVMRELAELKEEKGDREIELTSMRLELKAMQDQIHESKLLVERLELELSRATALTKTQAKQLTELENEKKLLKRALNAKTIEADELKKQLENAIKKEEARKAREAAADPNSIAAAAEKAKKEAEKKRAERLAAAEEAAEARRAIAKKKAEEKEARRIAEREAAEAKKLAIKEGIEARKAEAAAKRAAAAAAVEAKKNAYKEAAAARKAEAALAIAAAKEAAEARKVAFAAKKAAAAEELKMKAAAKKAAAAAAAAARREEATKRKAAAQAAFAATKTAAAAAAQANKVTKAPVKKQVQVVAEKEVEIISPNGVPNGAPNGVPNGMERTVYNVTDSFFATPAVGIQSSPPKTMAAKKQAINGAVGDDLRNLSPSALKRKTVKDLVAYLEAKGAPVTGSDGKPLRKAELLESVLASK